MNAHIFSKQAFIECLLCTPAFIERLPCTLESRDIKINKSQPSHGMCSPGDTDSVTRTASGYRDSVTTVALWGQSGGQLGWVRAGGFQEGSHLHPWFLDRVARVHERGAEYFPGPGAVSLSQGLVAGRLTTWRGGAWQPGPYQPASSSVGKYVTWTLSWKLLKIL